MNKPYVKVYSNGILQNPITKDNPYISMFPNRKQRRQFARNFTRNLMK